MKKKRVPIYIDGSDFLALPDQEKADAYFQLVDLLGKNSKPKKNSQNSNIAPSTDLTRKHERSRTRSKFGPPNGHPSPYGMRRYWQYYETDKGKMAKRLVSREHHGTDWASEDKDIFSAASGIVIFAGRWGRYGNCVLWKWCTDIVWTFE